MRILVTAGPTREPIDTVRFISNRSTGKMGYAVAEEAAARGHEVCLVSGPVSLPPPPGVRVMPVNTAEDMYHAVVEHVAWCQVLIMSAAVADWRPERIHPGKLKKRDGDLSLLRLTRTRDILSGIRHLKGARYFVGFAAETHALAQEAERKLIEKGLNMIVANDVSQPDAGFESDTNRVLIITADGRQRTLPLMSKRDVAAHLLIDVMRAVDASPPPS